MRIRLDDTQTIDVSEGLRATCASCHRPIRHSQRYHVDEVDGQRRVRHACSICIPEAILVSTETDASS